jgi:Flp pilus assembly protein TadD
VGLLFAASMATAAPSAQELDAMYRKAFTLIAPYARLSDRVELDSRTPQGRADLHQAIGLLTVVTRESPDNWRAYWLAGKAYQALRVHTPAQSLFKRAYVINQDNRDVAREYVIESICTGSTGEAVSAARKISLANRSDASLAANLALALLANGEVVDARQAVDRAVELDPGDRITLALRKEVLAAQSGQRQTNYCPP